jgi:DNA-binding NarL/FixJ family response regulator
MPDAQRARPAGVELARRAWPRGLTDREVEVLRLVARGRTTRQVGTELVISVPTANHHIEHIYGKAGVSSRAGAALFAAEHGLLDP